MEWKHFLGKFGPKNQNWLKWKLVPRLIPKCWTPWWCSICSLYICPALDRKYLFGPKNQNAIFKMKLASKVISICWIRWWCSLNMFGLKNQNCLKAHSQVWDNLATESPLKMMENAYYSTLKALFVLKIVLFLLLYLPVSSFLSYCLIRKIKLISKFMLQPG